MSSNPTANCFAFATGCHKLYLSHVGCCYSLKRLGSAGLAHDPSCCDGYACDTKQKENAKRGCGQQNVAKKIWASSIGLPSNEVKKRKCKLPLIISCTNWWKKNLSRGLQSNKYGSLRRMAMHGFRLDCKSVKKTHKPNYSSPLKNKLIHRPHTIDIKPICFLLCEIDFLLKVCWSIPCLHPSWKVHTWIEICASLNHRKKTKADGSRLIPWKHTETLVLLGVIYVIQACGPR